MRVQDPLEEITIERERARQLGDLNVDVCYWRLSRRQGSQRSGRSPSERLARLAANCC